jgi:tetratricopeptide (TPR) repeat protein
MHVEAWQRLQAGDLRTSGKLFLDVLSRDPLFYPARTGLGFVRLAEGQPKEAAVRFTGALDDDDGYLPAWHGLAEAHLALGDEASALPVLERLLALDPAREDVRSRLEVLRLRRLQSLIDRGRQERLAGRLDEARAHLEAALTLAASSGAIFLELGLVETAAGRLEAAELNARRAIALDASDAEAHAALGAALEAAGRYADAAGSFLRAAAIDPRPAWRERGERLRERAELEAIPAEVRAVPSAAALTRAQTAAMFGIELASLLARSGRHATAVATDIRGHWAEPWILEVTQAGIMEVFPNHTFQPATMVRRSDLAQILTQLITIATVDRPGQLAAWRSARPRFLDLPPTNVYYPAAALAVASGAMTPEAGRFLPTQPVSGAMLVAAIERLRLIAAGR